MLLHESRYFSCPIDLHSLWGNALSHWPANDSCPFPKPVRAFNRTPLPSFHCGYAPARVTAPIYARSFQSPALVRSFGQRLVSAARILAKRRCSSAVRLASPAWSSKHRSSSYSATIRLNVVVEWAIVPSMLGGGACDKRSALSVVSVRYSHLIGIISSSRGTTHPARLGATRIVAPNRPL
jgi:hypothetical protein